MTRGTAFLTLLSIGLFGTAAYAEPIRIDATTKHLDTSIVLPVGDSVVVHAMAESQGFEGTMPDDPLTGLKGPCFGSILAGTGGDGLCHLTGPDGDIMIVQWLASPKIERQGTWRVFGGTGRWDRAIGGGIFAETPTETAGEVSLHVLGDVVFN